MATTFVQVAAVIAEIQKQAAPQVEKPAAQ
jgi:hypothetical protein